MINNHTSLKIFFFLMIHSGLICSVSGQIKNIQFYVETGSNGFIDMPVALDISNFSIPRIEEYTLIEIVKNEQKRIPFQYEPGIDPVIWFILKDKSQANSTRQFILKHTGEKIQYPSISIYDDQKSLTFHYQSDDILRYQYAVKYPPEGIDRLYRRSGFIHPLWSPEQQILTRIQPPDHYHHYGIWNPWTKTIFKGNEIDFWNLIKGEGTVKFKGIVSKVEGPVFGQIKALQNHVAFLDDCTELTVLRELWDIRTWLLDTKDKVWLIDFTSVLNCATEEEIILAAYRYGGGIGFRARESWTKDNCYVRTSEGKDRQHADGTSARWCLVGGDTESKSGTSGILFMSHNRNRQHPEPMRVWPLDANDGRGDMYFEFCPTRHEDWILKPGQNYFLHYRMIVFDQKISAEKAELYWNSFVYSPEIKINNYE